MKHANVAIFVPHLGCPHACSFCDQRTISGSPRAPGPEEVARTAAAALTQMGERAGAAEIAFFGGSFTAVEPALMESLLRAAAPFVGPGRFRGIRVSTRPDAIDPPRLAILRRYGVTAVELGAQSMDDAVLRLNGRGHTAADVEKAAVLIRQGGFELGLQMMTGLYGSTPAGDEATARGFAAIGPDTVRVYPTIVLRGTRLAQLYREGRYAPQTLPEAVELGARLLLFFRGRGIRVIRLGLHAEEGIGRNYVAGPWHPAFRELCENRVYLGRARQAVAAAGLRPGEAATLYVAPGRLSQLIGQHRGNFIALEGETGVRLRADSRPGLEEFEVVCRREDSPGSAAGQRT